MTFAEAWKIAAAIILSLGGGGAIVFALSGYLGKLWADRALENQRHEHAKLNLEFTHQLGLVTEQTKSVLQIRAIEHHVRFAKLHEKRALVIAELYDRFVTAYWAAHTYHQWVVLPGGPTEEEQAASAWQTLHEAYNFFERNRIYLSHSLAAGLDSFFNRAKSLTFKVLHFGSISNKTHEIELAHMKARDEGLEAFSKEFPEMRQRLDAEFRKLLEPSQSTDTT
jgi:hypothetical protein